MGKGSSREERREALDELHAKVLGPSRIDPVAAAAIRECVARIPDELVAPPKVRHVVVELLDRLLRVAAVGISRLMGAPREIDRALAAALGEPEIGARRVYLALSALLGRTCLVERPSRQIWKIRLREACDPGSEIHRRMLMEAPRVVALADAPSRGAVGATNELAVLRAEVDALRETLAEERRLRVAAVEALWEARCGAGEVPPGSASQVVEGMSRRSEDNGAAPASASPSPSRSRGGDTRGGVGGSMEDREGASEVAADPASGVEVVDVVAMDEELMASLARALLAELKVGDAAPVESEWPPWGAGVQGMLAETAASERAADGRRQEVAELHEPMAAAELGQRLAARNFEEEAARTEVVASTGGEAPGKGPSQARRFSEMLHKKKRRR